MSFLLDTNVLIRAHIDHYGMDFCPGFWSHLVSSSQVFSVESVRREMKSRHEDMKQWVSDNAGFWKKDDLKGMGDVSAYVSKEFSQEHSKEFLRGADPMLVSFCMGHPGVSVVTYEVTRHFSKKKKVSLVDVCTHFGVDCVAPSKMLRATNVKLR